MSEVPLAAGIKYLESLEGQFGVARKLADGTPVTGFSPDETQAVVEFIGTYSRQRRGGGRLATFVDFPPTANPYTTIILGWWGLLEGDARAANKALVWVTTNGAMEAKAKVNARGLGLLEADEYCTWGQVALVLRHKPALPREIIIIGDVDFEPGNEMRRLVSDDGSMGHDEVLAAVRRLLSNPQLDVVLFHRAGWTAAFDAPDFDAPAMPTADAPAGSETPKSTGGCFIATACCGSPADPLVLELRRFRDDVLMVRAWGRGLAAIYARASPPVADWIGGRAWARTLVRHVVVRPLAWAVAARRRHKA